MSSLRWFRASASVVACALLVSLATLGLSLAGAHEAGCHDDCVVVIVHDASAHQVDAAPASPSAPPLHCLVCHWARSFRPRSESVFIATPDNATGIWINVEIVKIGRAHV